jgi:phosphoglycolate phosphatase (TIGR01487 family)
MRFEALATDYDGTLAFQGRVSESTATALGQFRSSGRKVILVTGRQIEDLEQVCPYFPLFDVIVAENGGVLYWPGKDLTETLGPPPDPSFLSALRLREVPFVTGQVVVATWEPYGSAVLETLKATALDLNVIFNKGAVMVLPNHLNKATGLAQALKKIGISPSKVIGAGDAENDLALLQFCGYSVAVANALPSLKDEADIVTTGSHGSGIEEIIARVLNEEER